MVMVQMTAQEGTLRPFNRRWSSDLHFHSPKTELSHQLFIILVFFYPSDSKHSEMVSQDVHNNFQIKSQIATSSQFNDIANKNKESL